MSDVRSGLWTAVSEAVKFSLVGVVNTLIGVAAILLLMEVVGAPPVLANAGGYAIGLTISYQLNRHFTFDKRQSAPLGFIRFLLVFAVSYGLNLLVLVFLIERMKITPALAQACAVVTYSIVFFVLCRIVVFKLPRTAQ